MIEKILFANRDDEEELREILWGYQMDLNGNIEEHVVLKKNHEVYAGAKVIEYEAHQFFIVLFGVKQSYQKNGLGGFLLSEIIANPRKYCREPITKTGDLIKYQITTIARGESVGFYTRYGFQPCDFSQMPDLFHDQCEKCLDKDLCNPIPMIIFGG